MLMRTHVILPAEPIKEVDRVGGMTAGATPLSTPLLFYPKRDAQSAVNHELKRIGGKA
jgi:hypothetical protein